MTPRHRKLLLALLACGLLALIAFFLLRDPEPSYKGKSLSAWLIQINDQPPNENQRQEIRSDAADAVEAIGTNALPYLLKWISYGDPRPSVFKRTTAWVMEKAPTLKKINGLRAWTMKESERLSGIPNAFEALGEPAISAIPELTYIANTSTNATPPYLAAQALAKIGPPALPALYNVLTNQLSPQRQMAIMGIGNLGPEASVLAAPLIECLNDKNPAIVVQSAMALKEIDNPSLVVPALTNLLFNLRFNAEANYNVAFSIAQSLAQCGDTARDTAPALVQYFTKQSSSDPRDLFIVRNILAITDSPQFTVPLLTHYLGHKEAFLSMWSAERLAEIGAPAAPALPALTNALQNSTGELHQTISNTIHQITSISPLSPRWPK